MLTFIDQSTDIETLLAPYANNEDEQPESIYDVEVADGFTCSEVEIKKETDKAVFVSMLFIRTRFGRVNKTHSYDASVWLPKSKVEIITAQDGCTAAIIPNWLYNAKLKETGCAV